MYLQMYGVTRNISILVFLRTFKTIVFKYRPYNVLWSPCILHLLWSYILPKRSPEFSLNQRAVTRERRMDKVNSEEWVGGKD